jgi:hypothetical protein
MVCKIYSNIQRGVIMLDLVDEMQWEDSDKVEFLTLEEAGLEMRDADTVPRAQIHELEDWEL